MRGFFVAFFEEGFLHVGVVGGSVENADFFVACFDLRGEDFEALFVAVGDDDGVADEGRNLVVALAKAVYHFELEGGGATREEGSDDAPHVGIFSTKPRDARSLEWVHASVGGGFFEGKAEEGFTTLFLKGGEFFLREVGVNEVGFAIVDDVGLTSEVEEAGNGGVNVSEVGEDGVLGLLGGIDLKLLAVFLRLLFDGEVGLDVFSSDHFEKEDGVVVEFGVERFEVFFVGDMDGTDEVDLEAVFFIGGDGGLEANGGGAFIDANEVGSFLGGGHGNQG